MPFPVLPGHFWTSSDQIANQPQAPQPQSHSGVFGQMSRLMNSFAMPANTYQHPQAPSTCQRPQASFGAGAQQAMPPAALAPSQNLVNRGAAVPPSNIKLEHGYSGNSTSGHTNTVVASQDLVVTRQQYAQNGTVVRIDGALPLGTRIINHVPLGPEDQPGTYEGEQRRKFRNMINWVNELGRLHPDLEVAQRNGWYEHIDKLNRHIRSLEGQLQTRLRKEANCPIFEALMPTYPQLWKYLDPKSRKRIQEAAPMATVPIPQSRRLEAPTPAPIIKSEPVADTKETILQTFASMPRPTPVVDRQHQGTNFSIQEPVPGVSSNTIEAEGSRDRTGIPPPVYSSGKAQTVIKGEVLEDDEEDCFIVSERQVNHNARNNRPAVPASTSVKRGPGRPRGSRNISKSDPSDVAGSVPLTRSLRNREVPLDDSRQRSRSPGFTSKSYRERSPRRDAIVEELSDSE